jgi:hypothetical protein
MNCFNKIINSTRPEYIYISGKEVFNNLIYTNWKYFTNTGTTFKNYNDQIKEIDIYIDVKHKKFNMAEAVLYSSFILYSLDSKNGETTIEKPEELFLEDINNILYETVKYWNLKEILKKKNKKCRQNYISDNDEITRSINYHSRILIINNNAKYTDKEYEINIYAINGNFWGNINTNLDIFKIFLDYNNQYNFYLNKEVLFKSIKNKIININFKDILSNLKQQEVGINNRYVKNTIEELNYYIGLEWLIYLKTNKCYEDDKGYECSRNCECMLRLNSEIIKEFHMGIILSKFYINGDFYMLVGKDKIVKINTWEGKSNLQNIWHDKYYVGKHEGEKISKDSEDNSYKTFKTIFDKMIMNKEFKQFIENPQNFIKFKLDNMYVEE